MAERFRARTGSRLEHVAKRTRSLLRKGHRIFAVRQPMSGAAIPQFPITVGPASMPAPTAAAPRDSPLQSLPIFPLFTSSTWGRSAGWAAAIVRPESFCRRTYRVPTPSSLIFFHLHGVAARIGGPDQGRAPRLILLSSIHWPFQCGCRRLTQAICLVQRFSRSSYRSPVV